MNARLVAWHLLRDARAVTRRAARRAIRDAELAPLDRVLLGRILGVETRRRAALRAIAESHAERKPRPDVALFVHVGLAQLVFLDDVPDHAAIGETVEAARTRLGEKPSAAVNALLRRVQRELRRGSSGDPRRDVPFTDLHFTRAVFADPVAHRLLWAEQALSLAVPIGRRWTNRYGAERAEEYARASLLAPATSVALVREDDALRAELASVGDVRATCHPRVVRMPASAREAVRRGAPRRRGDVRLLTEASVRAVELLDARAGERVLELRARRRDPNALLVASGAHVEARGLDDVRIALDAEAHFDAAFVLAPSSETGVLATKPNARWLFDARRMQELASTQESLLVEASRRTTNRVVYATRSIEPDENQRRVRAFVAAHPAWRVASELEHLPGVDGRTEGGYAALITRG